MNKMRVLENKVEIYEKFASPLITKVIDLAKGWELDKYELKAVQKFLDSDDSYLVYGYWNDSQKPFNFDIVKKDKIGGIAKELAGLVKSSPDYYEVLLIDKDGNTFELIPKVEYTDYALIGVD